jgi:hypothetical protein
MRRAVLIALQRDGAIGATGADDTTDDDDTTVAMVASRLHSSPASLLADKPQC